MGISEGTGFDAMPKRIRAPDLPPPLSCIEKPRIRVSFDMTRKVIAVPPEGPTLGKRFRFGAHQSEAAGSLFWKKQT